MHLCNLRATALPKGWRSQNSEPMRNRVAAGTRPPTIDLGSWFLVWYSERSWGTSDRKGYIPMADDRAERNRAIDIAIANIEKQFGKGSIMRLGEKKVVDVPAISTSCLSLDAAIGIGGVPRGRIVEIYGPESGGKTTLALHIVSQAQKAGGVAAYIDAEHAMDAEYAGKLGVNVNDLFISQPDSGEQALEITEHLTRSGAFDVIVI